MRGIRCIEIEGDIGLVREVVYNILNGIMKWFVYFVEEINYNIKFKCIEFCFIV